MKLNILYLFISPLNNLLSYKNYKLINNITFNGNDNRINIIENITIEELNYIFYKKKILNYLLNENITIYHKLEKIEEINDKYYIGKLSNGGLFKDFN
jgi:hypothetical protein